MTSQPAQAKHAVLSREDLRALIETSLAEQGYTVGGPRPVPPAGMDKARVRDLNAAAVEHRRSEAARSLARHEDVLLARIANGCDIDPAQMTPKLIEVQRGSEDERLFRYVSKHWSIPVSSGYGRRLRFLVVDDFNEKLIGILGLSDPVINLGVRDKWIGWDLDVKKERLHHVMDAFVIGAVPPYSQLLCGKLVAMLAASSEVQRAFQERYQGRTALISKRELDSQLALITTSSALGRSSIYNRLRYKGRPLYRSIGFTQGYGEFHFANGLYEPILLYAQEHCTPTERREIWGSGFRNRREVIRKVLMDVGLTSELVYHGVRREVFAVPLVNGVHGFLRGKRDVARSNTVTVASLTREFKSRWLTQDRLTARRAYRDYERSSYRLWAAEGTSRNEEA